ncbi:hypothetical protein AO391_15780 [Pseudomonas marginalis ICMP 9505]|uniref:Uncharacterized protein n=1 Tax=Pseudomonas kitaguniensis TaxID=2607908 RepID=A0A5N7JSN5_9PSED|nr:hypothetical protein [Pseudomonas kitaguniensis]KTC19612.1 hypothetical protein AO391_15780 [Pseudomonas marginalis ICMP 9505]MPQ84414.1 hypothetical protein [Pseudomonas kitaguniensis]
MKIRITEALFTDDTLLVGFRSSAGNGKALWIGTQPKIGDEVDVELDLDEVFSWGENLISSLRNTPHITVINEVTRITAEIIHGADEECAALKFGDSIILIELDEPIPQKSGFVEIRAKKIHLYPTNF